MSAPFDETGVWLFASLFSKINSSSSFGGVKDCDVASCVWYAALCKQWRDNNNHWPSLSRACRSLHVAPRPDDDEPCDMACLNNMLIIVYQDRFSVSFIHFHCSSYTSESTDYAKGKLSSRGGCLWKRDHKQIQMNLQPKALFCMTSTFTLAPDSSGFKHRIYSETIVMMRYENTGIIKSMNEEDFNHLLMEDE